MRASVRFNHGLIIGAVDGVSVVPPAPPELLRVAPSLTRIEWHAVRDALLFTEQNAGLVSDAHGRAHAKIRVTLSLDFGAPADTPPSGS